MDGSISFATTSLSKPGSASGRQPRVCSSLGLGVLPYFRPSLSWDTALSLRMAMSLGWIHNTYMDKLILTKTSAQFPDEEGNFSSEPADNDVSVLLIGTRCNHPLGLLAPGFAEVGAMFVQMAKDCEDNAEEFGFLGMTNWTNNSQRATNNELLIVAYFRTPEGLHNFAHSKYHTNA